MSGLVPDGVARVGRIPTALLRRGLAVGPMWLLRTTGRRTGRPHDVPVVVVRHGGARWLVSPFGEVAWVRNARVQPSARLHRGRRGVDVLLTEVDPAGTAGVLRRYRRRYGVVPFVRDAFDAGAGASLAEFAAEARRHPVFRLDRVSPVPPPRAAARPTAARSR